jgi:hypothetical protein
VPSRWYLIRARISDYYAHMAGIHAGAGARQRSACGEYYSSTGDGAGEDERTTQPHSRTTLCVSGNDDVSSRMYEESSLRHLRCKPMFKLNAAYVSARPT